MDIPISREKQARYGAPVLGGGTSKPLLNRFLPWQPLRATPFSRRALDQWTLPVVPDPNLPGTRSR